MLRRPRDTRRQRTLDARSVLVAAASISQFTQLLSETVNADAGPPQATPFKSSSSERERTSAADYLGRLTRSGFPRHSNRQDFGDLADNTALLSAIGVTQAPSGRVPSTTTASQTSTATDPNLAAATPPAPPMGDPSSAAAIPPAPPMGPLNLAAQSGKSSLRSITEAVKTVKNVIRNPSTSQASTSHPSTSQPSTSRGIGHESTWSGSRRVNGSAQSTLLSSVESLVDGGIESPSRAGKPAAEHVSGTVETRADSAQGAFGGARPRDRAAASAGLTDHSSSLDVPPPLPTTPPPTLPLEPLPLPLLHPPSSQPSLTEARQAAGKGELVGATASHIGQTAQASASQTQAMQSVETSELGKDAQAVYDLVSWRFGKNMPEQKVSGAPQNDFSEAAPGQSQTLSKAALKPHTSLQNLTDPEAQGFVTYRAANENQNSTRAFTPQPPASKRLDNQSLVKSASHLGVRSGRHASGSAGSSGYSSDFAQLAADLEAGGVERSSGSPTNRQALPKQNPDSASSEPAWQLVQAAQKELRDDGLGKSASSRRSGQKSLNFENAAEACSELEASRKLRSQEESLKAARIQNNLDSVTLGPDQEFAYNLHRRRMHPDSQEKTNNFLSSNSPMTAEAFYKETGFSQLSGDLALAEDLPEAQLPVSQSAIVSASTVRSGTPPPADSSNVRASQSASPTPSNQAAHRLWNDVIIVPKEATHKPKEATHKSKSSTVELKDAIIEPEDTAIEQQPDIEWDSLEWDSRFDVPSFVEKANARQASQPGQKVEGSAFFRPVKSEPSEALAFLDTPTVPPSEADSFERPFEAEFDGITSTQSLPALPKKSAWGSNTSVQSAASSTSKEVRSFGLADDADWRMNDGRSQARPTSVDSAPHWFERRSST